MNISRTNPGSLWLAAAALGLAGCVYIPDPHVGVVSSPADNFYRQNITPAVAGQFKPGVSTMADVMLVLGGPDAIGPNSRSIAYHTRRTKGTLVIIPMGGGPTLVKDVVYTFNFDPEGLLVSANTSEKLLNEDTGSQPMPEGFMRAH